MHITAMLYDKTGSGNSNITASKSDVLIYPLVEKKGTEYNSHTGVFELNDD